ncbi:MAG TPA: pilin [Candidatus Saccharimonadales bacterium]|nr:pilin [Candidatus Saccharimonadales bacterium]
MLQKVRKSIATTIAALALAILPAVALTAPAFAATGVEDNLKCGSNLQLGDNCSTAVEGGTQGIEDIVTTVINIFSVIVGIVSVIMIIYGGFRYVTSGGDSGNVSSAKNTIIYAVIGLVVVALAQFIVQFVLDKVTSAGV